MAKTKQIQSFICSASASHDTASLILTFTDGTTRDLRAIPSGRFAAIMAVLQATPIAFFTEDAATKMAYVTSTRDTPGIDCQEDR
jgi:hypothetical protein